MATSKQKKRFIFNGMPVKHQSGERVFRPDNQTFSAATLYNVQAEGLDKVKQDFNDMLINLDAQRQRGVVGGSLDNIVTKIGSTWTGSAGSTDSAYGYILPLSPARSSDTSSNNDEFTKKVVMYKISGTFASATYAYENQTADTHNSFAGLGTMIPLIPGAFVTPHDEFYLDRITVSLHADGDNVKSEHTHGWKVKIFAGSFKGNGATINNICNAISYYGFVPESLPSGIYGGAGQTAFDFLSTRKKWRQENTKLNDEARAKATVVFLSDDKDDYHDKEVIMASPGEQHAVFKFKNDTAVNSRISANLYHVGILTKTTKEDIAEKFKDAIFDAHEGGSYIFGSPEISISGILSSNKFDLQQHVPGKHGNNLISCDADKDHMYISSTDSVNNKDYAFGGGKDGVPKYIGSTSAAVASQALGIHKPSLGANSKEHSDDWFSTSVSESTAWDVFKNNSYSPSGIANTNINSWPVLLTQSQQFNFSTTGSQEYWHSLDIPLECIIRYAGVPIYAVLVPATHETDCNDSGWSGATPVNVRTWIKGGETIG